MLEDRSLLREQQPESERLRRREQLLEVASYVVKVSVRFLLRRARRYGRACVNFGAPLDVDAWLAERPGVLELPREERLPRLKELADDVMRRIAAIMPVTPVPLAATALLRHPGDRITRAGVGGDPRSPAGHAPATPAPTWWAKRRRAPRSSIAP